MSEVTHLEALISCILWKVVGDCLCVCLHAQTLAMGLPVKWNNTHTQTQITNASLQNNCVSLPRDLLVSEKAFHSWQHTLWKHLFLRLRTTLLEITICKGKGGWIYWGIWLPQQAYTPKSKMQKNYQKNPKTKPLAKASSLSSAGGRNEAKPLRFTLPPSPTLFGSIPDSEIWEGGRRLSSPLQAKNNGSRVLFDLVDHPLWQALIYNIFL